MNLINRIEKKCKSNKKDVIENIIFLVYPFTIFCLLGPMEIYAGNTDELVFSASDFFVFFLLLFIPLFVMAFILSFVSVRIQKVFRIAIFSISFMCYIQNMFLNKNLISYDGARMKWDEYSEMMVVNTIIWIIGILFLLIMPCIVKKRYYVVYRSISIFITVIQCIAVISLLFSTPWKKSEDVHYSLSPRYQYALGENNNIIVIVLDKYGNGLFEEFLNKYPEETNLYKDFTYYNNADSHYNYTHNSMTHLLTGSALNFSNDEFKAEAWQSDVSNDFYMKMHENDYICNYFQDVEVYAMFGDMNNVMGKLDNAEKVSLSVDNFLLMRLLEKMTIYKYAPYVMKPRFEVLTSNFLWCASYEQGRSNYNNGDFYEKLLNDGLSISSDINNFFTIIHIEGTHEPCTTSADGFTVSEEYSTVESTQLGLQRILEEYFNQLKELGKYDDSTIIVMSDHGWTPEDLDPQPIFLIKMVDEKHEEMQINKAPISYDDFLATILEIIGEEHALQGTSIFDWSQNDERERTLEYPWEEKSYTYFRNKNDLIDMMKNDL